ncbi:hypothetical protein B0T10DRAFT_571714 [Thelonectria olida]|uniref:Kelch repeat-containing protein n=1 Tax=Thelonectria olida TaxID=1576542 RepID=A0A9P8W598_9HYPO|nr:hypothetical protein B0T10DRAFT_571714 [Thelonectria olida]
MGFPRLLNSASHVSLLTSFSRAPLLALLLSFSVHWVTAKNPKDDFCRRFAHQTTVIDDKLYIDGGWVNFDDFQETHANNSNTWLAYHDLNKLVCINNALWPDLNISLSKNDSIPTVHGGTLWGDNVNKRFYLYGGKWNSGFSQEPYSLLSYDILNDKWDDFGAPGLTPPPKIASYGAGVGVSETGMGYYLGGWISNASMSGWTQPRTMSSNFYSYAYDTGKFSPAASLDKHPRAEGAMVWIPAGDPQGLLVYMGGILTPYENGTIAPQPFDEIFVFDARQFCMDVAWAPDKSSFNIYLWGGLSVPPPVVNTTSFNDIYILTIPSFIWVKAYPDHHGNATLPPEYDHYSGSCNMVKSMSQMFVIGGTYTDRDGCDLEPDAWAMHNFWTGTSQNAGDNETYWELYNPNITSNVVPIDVYSVVGGNKYGGATLAGPKAGFDSGNKPLQDLLHRRPSIPERVPTRNVSAATSSPSTSPRSGLSTGAIVGIAIGSAVGLGLVLLAWFCIGRRVVQRREERRQAQMMQPQQSYFDGSTAGPPNLASPHASMGHWGMGSDPVSSPLLTPPPLVTPPPLAPPLVPSELPAHQDDTMFVASELPQQSVDDKAAVSPIGVSSHGYSPAPAPSLTPDEHLGPH